MQTKKILHIMNGAVSGGISMTVLNMYEAVDRTSIRFDCTVYDTNLGNNGKKLEQMGCSFYRLPIKSRHPIKYKQKLEKIIKEGRYDAIHVHHNWSSYYPLWIGKRCGVKIGIAHAHSNYSATNLFGKIKVAVAHYLLNKYSTKLVACTEQAAISIFGEKQLRSDKLVILKNCIDTEKFSYNDTIRNRVRRELHITDAKLVGCVGNLGKEKNIGFALDILKKLSNEYVLLLIGDGEERAELEKKAKELNIYHRIFFLGRKSNVNEYLQAMDIFLMPSLYEGFGIAALEAAASGLPILLSSNIPRDFEFYSGCKYISLSLGATAWANIIRESLNTLNMNRISAGNEVRNAGYDIRSNSRIISDLYEVHS